MLPRAKTVWGGAALGAAILDVWCDRGEPNGDTITECFRELVDGIPYGRTLFAASCVGVPLWFYRHIAKEWT